MGKNKKQKAKQSAIKHQNRRRNSSRSQTNKCGRDAFENNREVTLDQLMSEVRNDPENIPAALALGTYYGRAGQAPKIPQAVGHLERLYPFAQTDQRDDYNRLLALGYGHLGQCLEAEKIVKRAIAAAAESMDIYYIQAYISLTLREYDAAIEACSQYLAILNAITQGKAMPADITANDAHASQLYNFLATAFKEKKQLEEAEAAYGRSISADPGNYLPYVNLANLFISQQQRGKARTVVEQGLKTCRQAQELRMLAATLEERPTVSACMIVKDEEELLEGCLESIRDWVDEIILVDTGSTDRTVEIAEQYGAKIFHQPWEGNFSKHRNYSIEQASSDWIFIIDADERFEVDDLKIVRPLLGDQNCNIISINVFNVYGDNNEEKTFLPSVRFFRSETGLRYEGIVHNVLTLKPETVVHRTPARIRHLGYDLSKEKMQKKAERTSALLEKQLEENPDNAFALFNYAQLLCGLREDDLTVHADRIIKMAGRAVELSTPPDKQSRYIYLMCLSQLAWTHFYCKDFEKAIEFANRALDEKPDYLDPLLLLGHVAAAQEQYDDAAVHYQKYVDVQAAYDAGAESENMIIMHLDSRVAAFYGLAMIADVSGDVQKAEQFYRKTVELDPAYLEASGYLGRVLMTQGKTSEAEQCMNRQVKTGNYSRESWMGLGYLAANRGEYARAENCYRTVLENESRDAEVTARLGRVLLRAGKNSEAVCMLKTAQDLDPDNAQIAGDLAGALFGQGQYREAADCYSTLLEQNTSSELLNDLGNCYFKLEDYDRASAQYRRALETEPVSSAAFRNLGLVEIRLGRPDNAVPLLERYYSLEPQEIDILRVIGDLWSGTGDYETALSYYEKYLGVKVDDVLALFRLSECYLHMGHRDSALMGYRRILQIDSEFKPAQQRLAGLAEPVGEA